ncbi:unnamed protein product [Brachionus calyciflorus]|uniref:Uncharacterized protein n=1 Tax=Brachionus calyciflorus TaxID=104777 RepID=A0A814DED4_9BILA|nr:unnamed protein product [Brachionus calyciflorus]
MSRACHNCSSNYSDCLREDCIQGDGITKTIETVNRQLPGPYIQVCQYDTIIVNVHNKLRSQRVASLHWHGLRQLNNSENDGVSMINQWPILPLNSYEYKFKAADSGTHFWHAHSGLLRTDGIFGPLIIRQKSDPLKNLYDFDLKEHYIILNEWHKNQLINIYGSYLHSAYFGTEYSILINGKSNFPDKPDSHVPLELFNVKKGFRYRFRLINSAAENCLMKLSIDEHKILIISTDGNPIEPIEVDSISLLAGERFDFVLNANNLQLKDFWIRVKGEGNCGFNKLYQRAILRYENTTSKLNSTIQMKYNETDRAGIGFRSNFANLNNTTRTYLDLKSLPNQDDNFLDKIKSKPNKVIYLNFDLKLYDDPEVHNSDLNYGVNQSVNNKWYSSFINEIKFEMPSKPALLHPNDLNNLCNETKWPCYLTNDQVRQYDRMGQLRRNFDRPVIKDTVTMPNGGYTIVRFVADNPGYWMFHCHIDTHSDPGENLNDYFTTTSTTSLPPYVNNPYGVNWGDWGPIEVCDQNDYVVGFRTKLHPIQASGLDDTALNGVEMICSNGKRIKSTEGQYGYWDSSFRNCSNGQKIIGFSYGIHAKEGVDDDTATNVIRLLCTDGSNIASLEGTWSTSIISVQCPYGAIVGFRTQVEKEISDDNTGLNNIEFICE